jgi:hypothetical protein
MGHSPKICLINYYKKKKKGLGTKHIYTVEKAEDQWSSGLTFLRQVFKICSNSYPMIVSFTLVVVEVTGLIIAITKRVDYCGNSQKNVHQNDLIYLS